MPCKPIQDILRNNSTIRVGIDATPMLVRQKTGVENYATELILALDMFLKEENEVELFLFFHTGNPYVERGLLEEYRNQFQKARCRTCGIRRGYGLALGLMALRERVSVLHLLRPGRLWLKPCPLILSVYHTMVTFPDEIRWLDGERSRREYAALLAKMDGIVAISQNTASELAEAFLVPPERIWVVPLAPVHGGRGATRAGTSTGGEKELGDYILYVGSFKYRKNLLRLIQSIGRLKSWGLLSHMLILVGVDTEGRTEVIKEVRRLGLESDVIFLGYVSDEDLGMLYKKARLLVYPSIQEGFGIPILEAMSYGTVVATSNVSSMPEVGGDAVIYFDPFDVDDIALAICRGTSDEGLRDRLSELGKARASLFTWERVAIDTYVVYRHFAL